MHQKSFDNTASNLGFSKTSSEMSMGKYNNPFSKLGLIELSPQFRS